MAAHAIDKVRELDRQIAGIAKWREEGSRLVGGPEVEARYMRFGFELHIHAIRPDVRAKLFEGAQAACARFLEQLEADLGAQLEEQLRLLREELSREACEEARDILRELGGESV